MIAVTRGESQAREESTEEANGDLGSGEAQGPSDIVDRKAQGARERLDSWTSLHRSADDALLVASVGAHSLDRPTGPAWHEPLAVSAVDGLCGMTSGTERIALDIGDGTTTARVFDGQRASIGTGYVAQVGEAIEVHPQVNFIYTFNAVIARLGP